MEYSRALTCHAEQVPQLLGEAGELADSADEIWGSALKITDSSASALPTAPTGGAPAFSDPPMALAV